MHSPLLSILIPAKDEAGNLATLLDEIAAALTSIEYEIIVVDDASTDDTWRLLAQRAATDDRIRPLRHAKSAGQSTSVWQAAWAARGIWLGTLDGDGQNDPADLPSMFERAQLEGVTLVAGHRTNRRDDWIKRLSSRIANKVRSAMLNDSTPDTGCGLKVIRRDAFLSLPYFNHMHRFLPALILAQGGTCISLPVNHRQRGTGKSHYGLNNRLWVGLVDMIGVMWLCRRSRLPIASADSHLAANIATQKPEKTPAEPNR
ncbi:glycosyltransferase family 2 protein [Salinicola salarius]|uniref:glycosyltransferase family 2 protein n=1 Tax=Salinicola salarius TaxID=430457 RepID=UPI000DA19D84|nr:glycosyltransferase family 2 protein [Salinicola salarius]